MLIVVDDCKTRIDHHRQEYIKKSWCIQIISILSITFEYNYPIGKFVRY